MLNYHDSKVRCHVDAYDEGDQPSPIKINPAGGFHTYDIEPVA